MNRYDQRPLYRVLAVPGPPRVLSTCACHSQTPQHHMVCRRRTNYALKGAVLLPGRPQVGDRPKCS